MSAEIEREELAAALSIPECFCGRVKKLYQPFCSRCFYLLPASAQGFVKAIRNNTSHGAYNAAIDFLTEKANVHKT